MLKSRCFFHFFPAILSKFDISKLENFVLLFFYCQELIITHEKKKASCCIIDTLLKQALQDESDLALHLYAFVIKHPVFEHALAELSKR
jgi:hypothetical protein